MKPVQLLLLAEIRESFHARGNLWFFRLSSGQHKYLCMSKIISNKHEERENMINSSVEGGTFPKLKQALVSNNIHFIHV